MKQILNPTRRGLLLGAASLVAGVVGMSGRGLAGGEPRDQGIGGTGAPVYVTSGDEDRGIGGTGIYGTIRAFGSIWVNGQRVGYAPDVKVTVDGAPANVSALAVGQVVQVVAHRKPGGQLMTDAISIVHEVVGRIDSASSERLTVLGQEVDLTVLARSVPEARNWQRGQRVAVSGLRRLDNVIVASLVQPVAGRVDLVRGPVSQDKAGWRIGALPVSGLAAFVQGLAQGTRVAVAGRLRGAALVASDARVSSPVPAGVSRVSIETYVQRTGGVVELANGLVLAQAAFAAFGRLPTADEVRAIIGVRLGIDGNIRVESLSPETHGAATGFSGSQFGNWPGSGGTTTGTVPGMGPGGTMPTQPAGMQPFQTPDKWSAPSPGTGAGPRPPSGNPGGRVPGGPLNGAARPDIGNPLTGGRPPGAPFRGSPSGPRSGPGPRGRDVR